MREIEGNCNNCGDKLVEGAAYCEQCFSDILIETSRRPTARCPMLDCIFNKNGQCPKPIETALEFTGEFDVNGCPFLRCRAYLKNIRR